MTNETKNPQISDLIFKELIRRGYSLEGNTRIWNIADSKLWCVTKDQANAYLDLEYSDEYNKRVIEKETKLFTENIPQILTLIKDDPINIIDFGCGDGKKITKFIEKIKDKKNIVYCPVDINEHMVEIASKKIKRTGVGEVVEFKYNVSDDKKASSITKRMRKNYHKKNIIFFLGNTINNSDINDTLFNLRNSMNDSDILIVDSTIDVRGQKKCLEFYKNNKQVYEWLVQIPENLGLNREDLEIGTRFQNNRVEVFFKIKKSKKIQKNHFEIIFDEGDEIIVIVSYRYKIRDFKSFLSINFNQIDVSLNNKGSMAIALCKK